MTAAPGSSWWTCWNSLAPAPASRTHLAPVITSGWRSRAPGPSGNTAYTPCPPTARGFPPCAPPQLPLGAGRARHRLGQVPRAQAGPRERSRCCGRHELQRLLPRPGLPHREPRRGADDLQGGARLARAQTRSAIARLTDRTLTQTEPDRTFRRVALTRSRLWHESARFRPMIGI